MQVEGTCSFEYDKRSLLIENPDKKIYSVLKDLASEMGVKGVKFIVK